MDSRTEMGMKIAARNAIPYMDLEHPEGREDGDDAREDTSHLLRAE
jgi:hypothetical protein